MVFYIFIRGEIIHSPELIYIELSLIDPSPYQHRRVFLDAPLKELARSIEIDGLIEPIIVRLIEKTKRYELIAGERRVRAAKIAKLNTILARIVDVSDIQARRMCAAENMQRQDLSVVEEIEAIVEMIDAEMIEDDYYQIFGDTPKIRVRRFLKKRKTAETNNYVNSMGSTTHRVDIIMGNLPSPKKWLSFLRNDLPLLNRIEDDVLDMGVRIRASKARLIALQKMKKEAPKAFKKIKDAVEDGGGGGQVTIPGAFVDRVIDVNEASAMEFDRIIEDEKTIDRRDHYFDTMPKPQLPDDKYRILYADPPWKYADKGLDDYGHAERHYNTMSIDDLCLMGERLEPIIADNAVLFIWVTSPLLRDSFKVIDAWGFFYKTSFVWDKVKHNFGHYNSVRHELLLICTRGSCTPDNLQLFDSVQTIERSDKHSEKPEEFRDIIDILYTKGKKLELFSRKQIENWDAWGDEVNDSTT